MQSPRDLRLCAGGAEDCLFCNLWIIVVCPAAMRTQRTDRGSKSASSPLSLPVCLWGSYQRARNVVAQSRRTRVSTRGGSAAGSVGTPTGRGGASHRPPEPHSSEGFHINHPRPLYGRYLRICILYTSGRRMSYLISTTLIWLLRSLFSRVVQHVASDLSEPFRPPLLPF